MKNSTFRRPISLLLIFCLLVLGIHCQPSNVVMMNSADLASVAPENPIVVKDIDGLHYRLLKWSIDGEGNIEGFGSKYAPG